MPKTSWRAPIPGYARGAEFDPVFELPVHRHSGELTSQPLELAEGGTLEFVPIVFDAPLEGCHVDLERVEAGRGERLWSGEPLFATEEGPRDPFRRLTHPVEVALEPGTAPFQLRWAGRGACAGAAGALARVAVRRPPDALPPVLLVCSDTHRYDHALGDSAALMPRLQQIIENGGVVYDRAYSNASWTLPSIASTLTGLHPRYHRTGARVVPPPGKGARLPAGQFAIAWGDETNVLTAHPRALPNLGERLRRYGYETAAVVANTLYVGSGLLAEGFDVVIDVNGLRGAEVNRIAQQLMERNQPDRPLFLLVHYMDVHEFVDRGRQAGAASGSAESLSAEDLRNRYARQVRVADEYLGRLVAAWNTGIGLKYSLVVFYSDHGEHLREPGRPIERHGDSMDEVLLHVPLVVRYPSALGVSPGREDRIVSLVDLAPTVLDVVGAGADGAELHGRSLLRPEPWGAAERPVFADYQLAGDELASVRAGPLKLVVNLSRGTRALVDVSATAGELPESTRLRDDAARREELSREFETYREHAERWSAGLATDRELDEDFEERLRAIGYAE
ncbi:MAG: sulfatase [Myxococcota bacterium]